MRMHVSPSVRLNAWEEHAKTLVAIVSDPDAHRRGTLDIVKAQIAADRKLLKYADKLGLPSNWRTV